MVVSNIRPASCNSDRPACTRRIHHTQDPGIPLMVIIRTILTSSPESKTKYS